MREDFIKEKNSSTNSVWQIKNVQILIDPEKNKCPNQNQIRK